MLIADGVNVIRGYNPFRYTLQVGSSSVKAFGLGLFGSRSRDTKVKQRLKMGRIGTIWPIGYCFENRVGIAFSLVSWGSKFLNIVLELYYVTLLEN